MVTSKTLCVLATLMLAGCGPNEPSASDAAEISGKLAYLKDRHGLCYAAINSWASHGYRITSITNVPCDTVGL